MENPVVKISITNQNQIMSQYNIEEEIEEIAGGEFERVPVPKSKLKGWKSFLGM